MGSEPQKVVTFLVGFFPTKKVRRSGLTPDLLGWKKSNQKGNYFPSLLKYEASKSSYLFGWIFSNQKGQAFSLNV